MSFFLSIIKLLTVIIVGVKSVAQMEILSQELNKIQQ